MRKFAKDLPQLSKKDLEQKITELRKQLTEQKRSRAAGELMNPYAITKTRRTIAVAMTLLARPSDSESKKEEAK
jgi:ribosomal protein L29